MAAEKTNYPVTGMVRLLEVTAAGFYAWVSRAGARRARVARQREFDRKVAY